MDFRSSTAPPSQGHDLLLFTPSPPEDYEKHTKSERQSPSPDSIELAASSLFHRVRAIISPHRDGSDDYSLHELTDSDDDGRDDSPEGSATPYYADEGESGETESNSGTNVGPADESRLGNSWLQYTACNDALVYPYSPSPVSAIQIKNGPERSIADSTVTDDIAATRRPLYLHSSSDQLQKKPPKRVSKRALGRVTPSPAGSRVGIVGLRRTAYSSSSDDQVEMGFAPTNGGTNIEVVRKESIINRAPSEPALVSDSNFGAIYDSSSSGRTRLDLFPKPLHVGSPPKRPADTPINTLSSPRPLIGIIPPTPVVATSSSEPEPKQSAGKHPERAADGELASTVVAHTGASTPDAEAIPKNVANKGTMTECEYSEYDSDEPGKLGEAIENALSADRPVGSEKVRVNNTPSETFPTNSYRYPDSPPSRQPGITHEEYIRSRPNASTRATSKSRSRSGSRARVTGAQVRGRSRSRGRSNGVDNKYESGSRGSTAAVIPVASNPFSKIITDLEEMLNQALELAGRAVADTNSALEERDASIRSAQESASTSMPGTMRSQASTRPSYSLERAVTAPESMVNFEEQQAKAPETLADKLPPFSELPECTVTSDAYSMHPLHREASAERETSVERIQDADSRTGPMRSISEAYDKDGVPRNRKMQSLQVDSHMDSHTDLASRKSKSSRATYRRSFDSYPDMEESKFRMEVGQNGEIILVKLPPRSAGRPEDPAWEEHPAPEKDTQRRRYKGGWHWPLWGKRLATAATLCEVGLIGWSVGLYHGEAPAIEAHFGITPRVSSLGNSMFLLGTALPTLVLWPLPLLHGRRPYSFISVALLLPLQLPQALTLPPYTSATGDAMKVYAFLLLFFRAISGIVMGFTFFNTLPTLVDLYGPDSGACCRGGVVYTSHFPMEGQTQFHSVPGGEHGVRMGIWLGLYAWLFVAFQEVGYLFGKLTIMNTTPAWGFWITTILVVAVLFFIALRPDVRPPWRTRKPPPRRARTAQRHKSAHEIIERGEIKMVVFGSSPLWWWEEVLAGLVLSRTMVKQTGFFLLALYVGWVFGHLTMVARLLASLIADQYVFEEVPTGLAVAAMGFAALFSIPLQLTFFYLSNFRHRSVVTMYNRHYGHVHEGEHPYRLALYIGAGLLPLASMALAISAGGPPTHHLAPIIFAALVSFAGTLATAECYIILMDNFDISDLPEVALSSISGSTTQGASTSGLPHGTQRPIAIDNPDVPDDFTTSHPNITSGFMIFHALSLVFGAAAVGCSTYITEGMGVRSGLVIYTGLTVLATIGLATVLWRRKEVRMLEVFNAEDRSTRTGSGPRASKISILQQGRLSRWSEVNGLEYNEGGGGGRV